MANSSFNWIVPLRRAVVKKPAKYRDFMRDWHEQLRIGDHAFVLGLWYRDEDDKDFTLDDYNKGLIVLKRWWKLSFGQTRVKTGPTSVTTLQTKLPNFHARFWKGPKRVLREQAADGDPERLAEIQPFDLVDGCIALQRDEQGEPQLIELLPGDVLEVPIHAFLATCGQRRFDDVEFDPKGSFYLGTTVKSKSGVPRTELPLLHDNMLAMRFQLVAALNMANCYHDKPVYTSSRRIPLPVGKAIDAHDWNDLCPGAGLIVVSSADGHEFGVVKLYPAQKLLDDAKAVLAEGAVPRAPSAGHLSAYNPLSGEDYCDGQGIVANGHFFVNESSAKMVPKGSGEICQFCV